MDILWILFDQSNNGIESSWTNGIADQLLSNRRLKTISTDEKIDNHRRMSRRVNEMNFDLIRQFRERLHLSIPNDFNL